MKHYGKVFMLLGAWWLAGAILLIAGISMALASAESLARAGQKVDTARAAAAVANQRASREEAELPAVSSFLSAWAPHAKESLEERELGLQMRAGLEALAQQRLGLVTDQATTPEPARLLVGGRSLRVQRVGLRATGDNLGALVTWLGEAEAQFPYARVDAWELSAAGATNCALRVTMTHPLAQETKDKKGGDHK